MIDTLRHFASEALSDEEIFPTVSTSLAEESSDSISDENLKSHRRSWKALIDDYLLEWASHPEAIEGEELKAPSWQAIKTAGTIAQTLAQRDVSPPSSMAPDGEGGIGFEWQSNNGCVMLEVDASGSIELVHVGADDQVTRHKLA